MTHSLVSSLDVTVILCAFRFIVPTTFEGHCAVFIEEEIRMLPVCTGRSIYLPMHLLSHRRATGLCPWPFAFLLLYLPFSPISSLAPSFGEIGVNTQQYADDTQIYISLSASHLATELTGFSFCLSALHNWFCPNSLALNSSKLESILFRTRQRLHSSHCQSVQHCEFHYSYL